MVEVKSKTAIAILFLLCLCPSFIVCQNLTVCQETGIVTDNLDLIELETEVTGLGIDFIGCGTLCEPVEGDCSHCVSIVLDEEEGFCLDLEEFNTANSTGITEVCCQPVEEGFCGVPSIILVDNEDGNFTFNSACSLETTPEPTNNPTKSPTDNPTQKPVPEPVDPDNDNTPPPTLPPFDSSASTMQVTVALLVIPFLVLRYL